MTAPRWTTATAQVVAQAIELHRAKNRTDLAYLECSCGERFEYHGRTVGVVLDLHRQHRVAAILDLLADAGVLIPVGGETRQEWRVEVHGHPLAGGEVYRERRLAEGYRRGGIIAPTTLLTRTVHTEPWREVTDDPA